MTREVYRWFFELMVVATIVLPARTAVDAAGGPVLSIEQLDTGQFPHMALTLQVLDSRGNAIQNLTADDFELAESTLGEQVPASIETLQIRTDRVGLGISIILDMRGDVAMERLIQVRELANALVASFDLVGGSKGDVAELWIVGADQPLQVGFTSDGGRLINKINQVLPPPLNSGSLNELVRAALSKTDSGRKRQVAIVISATHGQGEGLDSVTTQLALENQTPVFVLDLASSRGETPLKDLAITTGGNYSANPSPEGMPNIRDRIATQLKLEYVLGFRSRLSQDGREHTLRVVVRTPQGRTEASEAFRIPSDTIAIRHVSPGLLVLSISVAILGILFTYLAGRQFGYRLRARR